MIEVTTPYWEAEAHQPHARDEGQPERGCMNTS